MPIILCCITELSTSSGSNISTKTVHKDFIKWAPMAKQLHTTLKSICTMPSIGWNKVKHADTELWNSGNVFSGVINYALLSGILKDESWLSGPGECYQAELNDNVNFKIWWKSVNSQGLSRRVELRLLVSMLLL